MRSISLLALALIGAAPPPPAGRVLIGRYEGWAAFRDAGVPGCFAAALPQQRSAGARPPFIAVMRRPGAGAPIALHARLSHPRDPRAPVVLLVADRRFALRPAGDGVATRDARDALRILAALRTARRLEVRATGLRGGRFGDIYDLAGAPSAIDAAILACLVR